MTESRTDLRSLLSVNTQQDLDRAERLLLGG